MEPASWEGRRMLERHGVVLQPTTQFLCHPDDFAAWAASGGS
jgi:deoxyribodipyrimidine photolyase-related protein